MTRHSGGAIVALLSDISACWLVTAIPVAPIAAFTLSGLSSNPVSSRSTRGRGIIGGVGVGDSALPTELAHPTTDAQRTAAASAAVGWRMCSSRCQLCPTWLAWRALPRRAAHEHIVQQARPHPCEV